MSRSGDPQTLLARTAGDAWDDACRLGEESRPTPSGHAEVREQATRELEKLRNAGPSPN